MGGDSSDIALEAQKGLNYMASGEKVNAVVGVSARASDMSTERNFLFGGGGGGGGCVQP